MAARFLKGEHDLRNEQRMLQKEPLDGAIANGPIETICRDIFATAEKRHAAIAEAIDHAARTAALEVVELAAGTLQVASTSAREAAYFSRKRAMSFSRLPTRCSMGASVRARNGSGFAPFFMSFTSTS